MPLSCETRRGPRLAVCGTRDGGPACGRTAGLRYGWRRGSERPDRRSPTGGSDAVSARTGHAGAGPGAAADSWVCLLSAPEWCRTVADLGRHRRPPSRRPTLSGAFERRAREPRLRTLHLRSEPERPTRRRYPVCGGVREIGRRTGVRGTTWPAPADFRDGVLPATVAGAAPPGTHRTSPLSRRRVPGQIQTIAGRLHRFAGVWPARGGSRSHACAWRRQNRGSRTWWSCRTRTRRRSTTAAGRARCRYEPSRAATTCPDRGGWRAVGQRADWPPRLFGHPQTLTLSPNP